jgi:hypothetical protein
VAVGTRLFPNSVANLREEQFRGCRVSFPSWNEGLPQMPRYYFDMREGDEIAPDEEGMELRTIEAVQEEAARSLADMARDAIRRSADDAEQRMSIEVRDEAGPVMQVKFVFEVHQHRH